MMQIVLFNSSGGELDRKTGNTFAGLLKELADEGCLSHGDTIRLIDTEEGR